jgi:type IV pilus modification protein PilV
MQTQRAFSLTEALIAIVVIALGALAVAQLGMSGKRGTESALYATEATFIVSDMIERIRANPPRTATPTQTNLPWLYLPIDSGGNASAFDFVNINCQTDNAINQRCADQYAPASGTVSLASTAQCATAGTLALYDMFVIKCGLPYGTAAGELTGGYENLLPRRANGNPALMDLRCATSDAATGVCQEIRITLTWGERIAKPRNNATNASESTALTDRSISETFRP